MTLKSAAKTLGSGLLTTATVLADVGVNQQIREIDLEIAEHEKQLTELKERRADLRSRLTSR